MVVQEESFLLKCSIAGSVCALVSGFLNPVDVTKIRMQNQGSLAVHDPRRYNGLLSGAAKILREEGLRGWCLGMNATIARELLYSSVR